MNLIDLTDRSFHKLTVLRRHEKNSKHGQPMWECRCECGVVATVAGISLRYGNTKSCGCLNRRSESGKPRKECREYDRTYNSWKMMRKRVRMLSTINQEQTRRGRIDTKICDRWDVYANFLADMGQSPPGHCLLLIDAAGDYGPGNCEWRTKADFLKAVTAEHKAALRAQRRPSGTNVL